MGVNCSIIMCNVQKIMVSHWLLSAETEAQFQSSPCEIFGGQNGTGTYISLNTSVFPCQLSFHQSSIFNYHLELVKYAISGIVPRDSVSNLLLK
jgi:hypothetical protein